MEVYSIQGFLWKYKRSVTGGSWKKNWVYADNLVLSQFAGNHRPSANEAPKYSWKVEECQINPSNLRRFAFEVITGSETVIFAADDQESYQKWLKILVEQNQTETNAASEKQSELYKSEVFESPEEESVSDLAIRDFFGQRKFDKVVLIILRKNFAVLLYYISLLGESL
jgi:hypothetical protein